MCYKQAGWSAVETGVLTVACVCHSPYRKRQSPECKRKRTAMQGARALEPSHKVMPVQPGPSQHNRPSLEATATAAATVDKCHCDVLH